jgi:phospholipid/cholesterol/gamma-HCH transport system substrate-binding protein
MTRLSTVVERMRNTPGLARDTLAVALCAVLGFLSVTWIVSGQKHQPFWEDTYEFKADFTNAPGVRPQAHQEVRIAGVEVGRIADAQPTKAGHARLTLRIDPEHEVYDNARLLLRSKSPINIMYVTLDPGGPPGRPLPEGGVIPAERTHAAVQPYELLDKLDGSTRAALTSLINETDVALAGGGRPFAAGLDETTGAFTSFRPVLAQLDERRENLATLVHSFSLIAAAAGDDDQRLAELTEALNTTLRVLAARDDELRDSLQELPRFTRALSGSMNSVGELTERIDPVLKDLDEASDDLPDAIDDLTETAEEVEAFATKARPAVRAARPLLRDLRPFAADLDTSLLELRGLTKPLPTASRQIVPWMQDLAAFIYQTSSSFSLFDANGGIARASMVVDLGNPTGGLGDVEGVDP